MKLLLCPTCEDVLKLDHHGRYCGCGRAWGRYLADGLHAQISGTAVPLGFASSHLLDALRHRPATGNGSLFTAFVIPEVCDTVAVVPHVPFAP